MSNEIDQFQFDPLAPKRKTPETRLPTIDQPKSTPEGLGDTIKTEFTSPEEKHTVVTEFENSFSKKITEFSQEFQKAFCDKNGKVDLNKIFSLFGLENAFKDQIDSITGRPQPIPTVSNIPSTSPTSKLESKPTLFNGKIPERPINAPTGSQFIESQKGVSQSKMEQAIVNEIDQGNIPSFCRPENMKKLTIEKNGYKVTYKAALDYLSIGTNSDYIRIPITPLLAKKLATRYNWGLPTSTMTNHIYAQADKKLNGLAYPPGPKMTGLEYMQNHSLDIDKQLSKEEKQSLIEGKLLVAGHKKDLIFSKYAWTHPGKLDFRGLYIGGKPIQTNPAHNTSYRDYSHGFRPIDGNIEVTPPDGSVQTMKYYDALKDKNLASILNGSDGPIDADQIYND